MQLAHFGSCAALVAVLVSCASPPPPPLPDPPPPIVAPEPVPEPTPVPPPAPEPVVEPVPEAPAVEEIPVYEVTPEKKETTLTEIRTLVDKLNAIIEKKTFSEWRSHLDQDYIKTYSDPVRLKEYSASSPFLKQFNIKLKTLEDYFKFVVVPSRADTVVDDITFVDENRVNVWTVVDNERVLLYLLKLYDTEWKISSW